MRHTTLLLVCVVIISLWQGVTSLKLVSSIFIPSPVDVFYSFIGLFVSGQILYDLVSTLWRTLLSFTASVIFGTLLGISIGYFTFIGHSLEMFIDFLRSIPPVALFPLFLLFFGIGDLSKIAVGIFSGTMIITVAAMYGTKAISKTRLILAKKIGLRGRKLFHRFLLPESLYNVFEGYRLAISICLILIIVTEMFLGGVKYGLGMRLVDAHMLYRIPDLYALIIISGLIGYALNIVFALLENRIIHWKGK